MVHLTYFQEEFTNSGKKKKQHNGLQMCWITGQRNLQQNNARVVVFFTVEETVHSIYGTSQSVAACGHSITRMTMENMANIELEK